MNSGEPVEKTPPVGTELPESSSVCSTCGRPMIANGGQGECSRCLVAFAFLGDEEGSSTGDGPVAKVQAPRTLRFGHLEIEQNTDGTPCELGSGAMGTTYLARDTSLNSAVALKIISGEYAHHPGARARFLREARAAARLRHPNAASVFHYGEQDGECFYVMELVEGETLEARVRRDGPLPASLALEVTMQVARALAAAEAQGIVHRDLKPSNIMLSSGGSEEAGETALLVKVIDFGLAKTIGAHAQPSGLADTRGGFVGTPAFASPEQFVPTDGDRIDTRSDIYALGVTLWYLLTGRLPFVGETLVEVHARQTKQALPWEQLKAVRVPGSLVDLLTTMLAVSPADRPQNARELLLRIQRCARLLPPPPAVVRRRRAALVAGVLLLLALGGVWAYRATRPPPDRSVAVLPFQNLSPDPANAFFAVGMQEKIADDLARLADLKALGGESTRSFDPGEKRDFAAIGHQLGVRHLVEGSVRRENARAYVVVRLVDVEHPGDAWQGSFDQPLTEVFPLQRDITRAVADRLRVSIAPREGSAIDRPLTTDVQAYDLYLRAEALSDEAGAPNADDWLRLMQELFRLFGEAIKRDPKFVLAYCRLSDAHLACLDYRESLPPEEKTVDHRSLADSALATARRLAPDDGEVHMAVANFLHIASHDDEQALIEVNLARKTLPNNKWVELLAGDLAFTQGKWDEAIRHKERVLELDPMDTVCRHSISETYRRLRRYADFDRAQAAYLAILTPERSANERVIRTFGPYEARAELGPMRKALAAVTKADDPTGVWRGYYGATLYFAERNPEAAYQALELMKQDWFGTATRGSTRKLVEARIARSTGDTAHARSAFSVARVQVAEKLAAVPNDGRLLAALAVCDAGLGDAALAEKEALQACDLEPIAKHNDASFVRARLAVVYAWTGRPALALDALESVENEPTSSGVPGPLTYGDLVLNPDWDSLRSEPRFVKLVEHFAPSH